MGAAWLFGSFGRAEADCWSDIDVVIVVDDDEFDAELARRYDLVAGVGDLVLSFESSYNGPPGGCYLMTGYESPTGLLLVDWYWQPRRIAQMAPSKSVLVNRAGIRPHDDVNATQIGLWQGAGNEKPLPLWNPTEEEDRANCGALAWAMLAIQAKYVARKPDEAGLGFQEFIENLIARAGNKEGDVLRFGNPGDITGAVNRLDRLKAIATELRATAPGCAGPQESLLRFLDTVREHCSWSA